MTEEKRGPGAPTKYTPELAQQICDLVAGGMAFKHACAECGVTGRSGRNWLKIYPDFVGLYQDATEDRGDDIVDELLELVDKLDPTSPNAQAEFLKVRLQVDTRKWIAGKMRPKKYNDRLIVDHAGSIKHNVTISEMTDEELEAIAAGRSAGTTGEA